MKNNLSEIKSTLEGIRSEYYPDIPSELISTIVEIQNQFQGDESRRQSETQKLIIQYANDLKVDGGD